MRHRATALDADVARSHARRLVDALRRLTPAARSPIVHELLDAIEWLDLPPGDPGVDHPTRWSQFAANVVARLDAGKAVYGDRSFERRPEELSGEIEEELLDVCAWSFILWCRVLTLRQVLEARDG